MQKLGGTRVRLYYKNLITYKIAVPTVKEQQAIGTYFSNLDNLINSHQEKNFSARNTKKETIEGYVYLEGGIMKNANTKHHIVPQSYLKRFVRRNSNNAGYHIGVYQLESKKNIY